MHVRSLPGNREISTFAVGSQRMRICKAPSERTSPKCAARVSLAGDIHLALTFLYSRAAAFSQSPNSTV